MKKIAILAVTVLMVACLSGSAFAGNFWDGWKKGIAKGIMPPCGTNVLALGADKILQETVNTYCALEPGKYQSYINPKVMSIYKANGTEYPNGRTAVLVFPDIGVVFTTDHKDGQPVYDVLTIKDEKSIASTEAEHPLNKETCATCHITFDNVCVDRGFTCGNREM